MIKRALLVIVVALPAFAIDEAPEMVGTCFTSGGTCYNRDDCTPVIGDFCRSILKTPDAGTWMVNSLATNAYDGRTDPTNGFVGERFGVWWNLCAISGSATAANGWNETYDWDTCVGDSMTAAIKRNKLVWMKVFAGKRMPRHWFGRRSCELARNSNGGPYPCTSDAACIGAGDSGENLGICLPQGPVSMHRSLSGQTYPTWVDPDYWDYVHSPTGPGDEFGAPGSSDGGAMYKMIVALGDWLENEWGVEPVKFCDTSPYNFCATSATCGGGNCVGNKTNLDYLVAVQATHGGSGDGGLPSRTDGVELGIIWNAVGGISGTDDFRAGTATLGNDPTAYASVFDGVLQDYPATTGGGAGEGMLPDSDWWVPYQGEVYRHYKDNMPGNIAIIMNPSDTTSAGLSAFDALIQDVYGVGSTCTWIKDPGAGGQWYGMPEMWHAGIRSQVPIFRDFQTINGVPNVDLHTRHEIAAGQVGWATPMYLQAPLSGFYWTYMEKLGIGMDHPEIQDGFRNIIQGASPYQWGKAAWIKGGYGRTFSELAGYKSARESHASAVVLRVGLDSSNFDPPPVSYGYECITPDDGKCGVSPGTSGTYGGDLYPGPITQRSAAIASANAAYGAKIENIFGECIGGTNVCSGNVCVDGQRKGLACSASNYANCPGCIRAHLGASGLEAILLAAPNNARMAGKCSGGVCTQGRSLWGNSSYGGGCSLNSDCDVGTGVNDVYQGGTYLRNNGNGQWTINPSEHYKANGNYEVFMKEITPLKTRGHWRVGWDTGDTDNSNNWPLDKCNDGAPNYDSCAVRGRFAKSFGTSPDMRFNVEDAFWYNPTSPDYDVWVRVDYYSKAGDNWSLHYDGDSGVDTIAKVCDSGCNATTGIVAGSGSGTWKAITFQITDARMQNLGQPPSFSTDGLKADLWLKDEAGDSIFHMVKLTRKEGMRENFYGVCSQARWSVSAAICGDSVVDAGEDCDEGGSNSNAPNATCRTDCTDARCGDGIIDTSRPEACDDGASNSDVTPDACRTDCALASCGDSVVDTGETCDDGGTTSGDGCSATCQTESCGNGIVDGGEACDPGSPVAGDCCTASCQYEVFSTPCDDGAYCLTGEACTGSSATCPAGTTPMDCSDADICTDDSCNESTDSCVNTFDVTNDPSCEVSTGDLYVDKALGTDVGGCGSSAGASACNTIQYTIDNNTIVAGDTVNIADGVYPEQVVMKHAGSAVSPITFRGASKTGTVIDGTGVSVLPFSGTDNTDWGLVRFDSGQHYVTLRDITIRDSEQSGISVHSSTHVTIDNVLFVDNATMSVLFFGNPTASYSKVINSEFTNCGKSCIQWKSNTGGYYAAVNNTINSHRGLSDQDAIASFDNHHLYMKDNTLLECATVAAGGFADCFDIGGDQDSPVTKNHHIVIEGNLVDSSLTNGAGWAIALSNRVEVGIVRGNMTYATGIMDGKEAPWQGGAIYNNTGVNGTECIRFFNGDSGGCSGPSINRCSVDTECSGAETCTDPAPQDFTGPVRVFNNICINFSSRLFHNWHPGIHDLGPNDIKFNYNYWNTTPGGNLFTFRNEDFGTLDAFRAAYPTQSVNDLFGTVSINTVLNDAFGLDFSLPLGSPVINAGGPVATVTQASSSGTVFTVDNWFAFYDGWFPGHPGDTIVVGTDVVTIQSINETTGALTVAPSFTWTQGDPVYWREFYGSAPDMGALESGFTAPGSHLGMTNWEGAVIR